MFVRYSLQMESLFTIKLEAYKLELLLAKLSHKKLSRFSS